MSQDNVYLVRRIYEAYASDDPEAALSLLHPDIEWVEPPDSPDTATHRGHDGVRRSMEGWAGAWEGYGVDVDNMIEAGDGVLVRLRQHGHGRGSGVGLEERMFHVWTLRDGKAVRMRMYREEAEALGAARARGDAQGYREDEDPSPAPEPELDPGVEPASN